MTERHIERVVVQSDDHYVVSLGMAEVLAHYASTSHLISLRLARANSLREIGQAVQGLTELVRTVHAQCAKMNSLMELIRAPHHQVMAKISEKIGRAA